MGGTPRERKRYILFRFDSQRKYDRKDFIGLLNAASRAKKLEDYKVWLTVYEPPYAIVRCLHLGQGQVIDALNSLHTMDEGLKAETIKTSGTIITLKEKLANMGDLNGR